jgi:hypothetical protein
MVVWKNFCGLLLCVSLTKLKRGGGGDERRKATTTENGDGDRSGGATRHKRRGKGW